MKPNHLAERAAHRPHTIGRDRVASPAHLSEGGGIDGEDLDLVAGEPPALHPLLRRQAALVARVWQLRGVYELHVGQALLQAKGAVEG